MKKKSDQPETAIFVAFDDSVPFDPAYPEKSLMAAILSSVFDDLKKQGREYRDARSYVLSNDTGYIYSFRNVCLHLGLCAHTIRELLSLELGTHSEGSDTEPRLLS